MAKMSKQQMNDAVLKAVGHPIRRQILRRLEDEVNGGISPKDLAEELKVPLGNVSYHVRTLKQLKVLKQVRVKPARGAMQHFFNRSRNPVDHKVTEMLDHIGKE